MHQEVRGVAAGEPEQVWFEPDVGHLELARAYPVAYEQRVMGVSDAALLGQ